MTNWVSVKEDCLIQTKRSLFTTQKTRVHFFARRIESDFECWDAVTREFVNWRWIPYGYTCITLESVTHWMPLPAPPKEEP